MSRGMAGMVLFIASEVMLFGGLFAGYFFVRNQATVWPPEGVHEVAAGLGGLLTVILVVSGLFGHTGIVAVEEGQPTRCSSAASPWRSSLASIFIGGQTYEWLSLMDEGLNAGSTVYGSTFYVITGFHGAHVIVGSADAHGRLRPRLLARLHAGAARLRRRRRCSTGTSSTSSGSSSTSSFTCPSSVPTTTQEVT